MGFSAQEIEKELRAFLAQNAPNRVDEVMAMELQTKIMDVIDSLSLLELIDYIEQRFQIRVAPLDLLPENFATLENTIAYVSRQLAEESAAK